MTAKQVDEWIAEHSIEPEDAPSPIYSHTDLTPHTETVSETVYVRIAIRAQREALWLS